MSARWHPVAADVNPESGETRILEWTVTAELIGRPAGNVRRQFVTLTDAHRFAATLREGTYRNVRVGRLFSEG